jgi:DNA-binding CsgD family transcriptional regulator
MHEIMILVHGIELQKMINQDENFAEYFVLAQEDALTPRQSRIVDLRYGFANGEHHTLQQIGQEFGLSRERIRQILQRSLLKIRSKGRRQISRRETDSACARLLLYLERILRPEEPGNLDRIFIFSKDELGYLPQQTKALPLIVYLLYGQREPSKQYFAELIKRYQEELASLKKAVKPDLELKKLLSNIIWPREVIKKLHWSELVRKREVSPDGIGISGSFFSEKMSREVQYEPHMELQFLLKLEHAKDVVLYQEQPLVIPHQFDGQARNYYPDVLFVFEDGRGVVVEIKPRYQMVLYENLTKWSALYKFCLQNGWGLLVTDGTRHFQKLQDHEISVEYQTALLSALANSEDGTLSWKEYRDIKDQYSATWNDFLAIILKNRLEWNLQPFVLKQRGS